MTRLAIAILGGSIAVAVLWRFIFSKYGLVNLVLVKLGLEPIETAGQRFDPNLHQAVERVETGDAEDQSILGEFQRGYNFKGKLLRPAMVRVVVRP